ncbi:MAG TPA: M1 family metallopeptidase, partial [Acidimicrobiales bacterium]
GDALLEIAYDAPFAATLSGLYRVEENGVHYAYTQFESTDARRAFPCFDEPAFKTAYDITIASPAGTMALANSPEASHEDGTGGMVVHHFATTRPLPSYLVAFAVGDFDVAEGQTSPFPIRVITTKGRAGLTGIALDAAAGLVAKLGEYFGIRYPYEKLDLVAVPEFDAGAMENPGLVTFRDEILLLDPEHATTEMKRGQAETIAHEFAHQWFGDLVTMQWWDDIWLNEGFATWAEAHMVDAWKPSFGATIDQIADVQFVMDTDALKSARAVRQPVTSTGEVLESFDGLTYEKGAAVLRMLESWLGPDTFRRGVQRYLHDNAWKNAKADDLFHALEFVSAQSVSEMAHGFLDKPGVPSVQVNWKCGGKLELR